MYQLVHDAFLALVLVTLVKLAQVHIDTVTRHDVDTVTRHNAAFVIQTMRRAHVANDAATVIQAWYKNLKHPSQFSTRKGAPGNTFDDGDQATTVSETSTVTAEETGDNIPYTCNCIFDRPALYEIRRAATLIQAIGRGYNARRYYRRLLYKKRRDAYWRKYDAGVFTREWEQFWREKVANIN